MKNKILKIILAIVITIVVVALINGYELRKEKEEMARADYGMYISRQYNILTYLRAALDIKNNPKKFSNELSLVKGEIKSVSNILDHSSFPESIWNFHRYGQYIVNKSFSDAVQEKPLKEDIVKLELYEKQLTNLVRKLNYSSVIENKRSKEIYNYLDKVGNEIK